MKWLENKTIPSVRPIWRHCSTLHTPASIASQFSFSQTIIITLPHGFITGRNTHIEISGFRFSTSLRPEIYEVTKIHLHRLEWILQDSSHIVIIHHTESVAASTTRTRRLHFKRNAISTFDATNCAASRTNIDVYKCSKNISELLFI